jgi:superfamily II DNA/RNA helicase
MLESVLISDIPDDYLNLYANAYAVYTDRVHACIATLSFGNLARLYSSSHRNSLFEKVGAEEIEKRLVKLDQDRLNIEKEKHLSFLREILTEA